VNASSPGDATERSVAAYERDSIQYADRALQIPEQMLLGRLRGRWPEISMLDIGVGAGRTAFTFAPLAGRYVGFDISERMVELSRGLVAESETISFRTADARTMVDELDGPFDLVLFSFNGIDNVGHDDRLVILDQVRRLVAADGLFVFSSHSLNALPLEWAMPPFLRRSPVVSLYGQAKAVRHRARLRRVNAQVDVDAARARGWDRINDGDHGFEVLYYYVLPAEMERQLAGAGFALEAIYDHGGRSVTTDEPGRDPWLYYYCRPAPG
jgi:SAM-dependent methyltransferase